ncbi:MAG: hypothetical protein NVS2B12_37160 [Ktedonobacteraceae bacterium]
MFRLVNYAQQFGRFQRNARLYLLSNVLSGVTLGIILVLYNLYIASLGYDTAFIGLLFLAGTIGAGIAIFPAGICFDRLGGRALLIWASALIGVAGAGQMLFRTPIPLLVSTFLVGVGGAFVLIVNTPFLTRNSTPAERAHLFSLAIVLTLLTTVLGEVLGGALPLWLRSISWLMAPLPAWWSWSLASQPLARSYQLALLLAGLIAAPSFIPLFFMDDDRPESAAMNSLQEISPVQVIRSFGARVRGVGGVGGVLRMRSGWDGRELSVRALLAQPLFAFVIFQLLIGTGAGLFLPYFNLYFVQHLRASPALFGAIDGSANALNALLTLLAPWAVLRFGKIATLLVPRLLSIPLMLVIGLTPSLPVAASLYPFRQGLMDMSQGILQLFSMEVVDARQRGFANSSYQAAYQVAWALSASLSGLIIARVGYAPVFVGAAVLYTLALLLLWVRFGRGSEQHHDDSSRIFLNA